MGNTNSGGGRRMPRAWRTHPSPPPPPHRANNSYVFAAATPYPNPYPNPNPNHPSGYYPYPPPMQPGYYPPPAPMPLPGPANWAADGPANWASVGPGGRYPIPYGPPMMPPPPPLPYVEHQKAVTIRNDVNVKKETLRVEPDHDNPGQYLVAFTFDATVSGSITVMFFAKEGENCKLIPTIESLIPPMTVPFQRGLGQKFRQASGTGIDFSMFEMSQLVRNGEGDVCPLAVKTEVCVVSPTETPCDGNLAQVSTESQITKAVFDKEGDEYKVKVLKQILWVNKTRYELQEIYGIGNNSREGEMDGNDSLKECVICLNEPRDTTVLPCRHMCLCSECAKVLRFQTNRCPICRQPIERLLEIKVSNGEDDEERSST